MSEKIFEFRVMNPALRRSHERTKGQIDLCAYCVILVPTECFWNKKMNKSDPFNNSSWEPVEKKVKEYSFEFLTSYKIK